MDNIIPLKINDQLPELVLNVYDPKKDQDITLNSSSYKGKWMVFFFYPSDFTFVCPTELEVRPDVQRHPVRVEPAGSGDDRVDVWARRRAAL